MPAPKLWVKICANTNLADARGAVDAGADALGFVFAPSPRRVDAATARAIGDTLPGTLERIGVFAGSTPGQIREIAVAAGLTGVQLHGAPAMDILLAVRERLASPVDVIATIAWPIEPSADDPALERIRGHLRRLATELPGSRVLIDAEVSGRSGGLGARFDWLAARQILGEFAALRIILAGGLTPENVWEATETLSPWGVDVASGVELRKGKKDPEKVRTFLRNARGGEQQPESGS